MLTRMLEPPAQYRADFDVDTAAASEAKEKIYKFLESLRFMIPLPVRH